VDGMSIRQAAREFGLSRKSIRNMLQFSLPPGYARKKPVQRPKLGPWLGIIDQILADDQSQPNQHPVPATQHPGNLPGVTFRYQLDARSGIITRPVWFRLCRVRRLQKVTGKEMGKVRNSRARLTL
jgi:hypothetical protein